MDTRSLLPPVADLQLALADSKDDDDSGDEDGRPFTNRYLTRALAPNLVMHLSAGSGAKTDTTSWHTPAVLRLAKEIRRTKPVLVIAADVSRWGRDQWALAPFVQALKWVSAQHGRLVYLSDGQVPVPFDLAAQHQLYFRVAAAAAEREMFLERTRNSFERNLVRTYQGAPLPYPHHQPPPPPCATAWLLDADRQERDLKRLHADEPDRTGGKVVYLDTAASRPPVEVVKYGAPTVLTPEPAPVMTTDPAAGAALELTCAQDRVDHAHETTQEALPQAAEAAAPLALPALDGRVDQLALVRLYFKLRYEDGWSKERAALVIAMAGYSTPGLRKQRRDPGATWIPTLAAAATHKDPKRARRKVLQAISRTIESNQDFYPTGQFTITVPGVSQPILYRDVWPDDGQRYLSPKAEARWIEQADADQRRSQSARQYTYSGVMVEIDGRPGRLSGYLDADGAVCYGVRPRPGLRALPPGTGSDPVLTPAGSHPQQEGDEAASASPTAAGAATPSAAPPAALANVPGLPAHVLTSWICESIVRHHADLSALVPDASEAPRSRSEIDLHELRVVAAELRADQEARWPFIDPGRRDRPPRGASWERLNQVYDETEKQLSGLDRDIERLESVLAVRQTPVQEQAIAAEHIVGIFNSLRDTHDVRFTAHWVRGLHGLSLHASRRRVDGIAVHTLEVTDGQIRFHDGDLAGAIPLSGRMDRLARPAFAHEAAATVVALRAGDRPPRLKRNNRLVLYRRLLGLPPGTPVPMATIGDPRLLRIAMAVCHPPVTELMDSGIVGLPLLGGPALTSRQLPAAARRLGEPLALLRRVHRLDDPAQQETGATAQWIYPGDAGEAELFAIAATHGGVVTPGDARLHDWRRLRIAATNCRSQGEWTRLQSPLRLELRACPWCGGRNRIPLRIREATEPVCRDCERDTTGIPWPLDHYGQWALTSR